MHAAKVNSSVFRLLLVFPSRCTGRTLCVSFVLHNDEMESMCALSSQRCTWPSDDALQRPKRSQYREKYLQKQQQHRRRYWLLLLLDFCERWYGHMMKTNFQLEPNRCLYVCTRWCNLNFKRIAAMKPLMLPRSFRSVEEKIIVGKSQHYANLNRSYCLIFWSQFKIV